MSYSTHNEHHHEYLKYILRIHPENVGMFVGKTILKINNQHRGWAMAQLQQLDDGPVFIISGHPGHVTDIAVSITEIATTEKIRNSASENRRDPVHPPQPLTHPPHLNSDGSWPEPAPEYHRP